MAFASRDPNKRDADHVDFWLPLFERALSDFVRTKQKSREKYRQLLGQYESDIKSALKSEGGRNRLRESGWSEEKMRREIEQAVSKVVENSIRTTNAVGRDKQDAASVEMWIGLFNNFLNWSLKKHGDPAKARKNGETILKNIEDSLDSDGGREQLKKMGWTMQKLRDALEKGLRERFVQNSVRTTNPIVRKALNSVATNAKFKVGDKVKLSADAGAWRKGETGTVRGGDYLPGFLFVEFDGGTKGRIPEAKLVAVSNSRTRNAKFKVGDKVEYIGPITDFKGMRGVVGTAAGVRLVVKMEDGSMHVATEDKFKAANARACNSTNFVVRKAMSACNTKWVVLYRDGGKEKIDAPSHAEAKRIADEKSKRSGRGYISVIVDDGVDYGINATAKNATEWEKVYQIKGMPVKLVWRGEPFNDLKATVEGGNRTYVPVARIIASNPVSQTEAEKLCAAKWRQIKATANAVKTTNAVVAKAMNAQLHDYEVPVVKRGVKSTVTIRRVADEETAKKLAADPLTGTEVDVSRSVSVLNARG